MKRWILALLLGIALAACADQKQPEEIVPVGQEAGELRTCVRIVDGDTIVLDVGERVRYIGIDTPETVHPRKPVQWMGKEASEANRILVEGKRVRLESDAERKDKYGRTLAYVWLGDTMVNERLVQLGYAQVSTYPPNVKYVERLQAAQLEAREAGRGLWGARADSATVSEGAEAAPPQPEVTQETVYVTRTGAKYHRAGCQYLRRSKIPREKSAARAAVYGACKRCRP